MNRIITALAATFALAATLTACGSSTDETPSDPATELQESADAAPKCADVWQVGETLPDGVDSCVTDAGAIQPFQTYDCTDGTTVLYGGATDDDTMAAAPGEEIWAVADMGDICGPHGDVK